MYSQWAACSHPAHSDDRGPTEGTPNNKDRGGRTCFMIQASTAAIVVGDIQWYHDTELNTAIFVLVLF